MNVKSGKIKNSKNKIENISKEIRIKTKMSSSENTQLTPAKGYDAKKRMVFSEPISGTIPGNGPKIEFKRINISTRNNDGTIGELVIPTTKLFSFGVGENKDQNSDKVTGYTFPICLYSRDGPTDEEKTWVETFDKIVDRCVEYILEHKDDIDQYELTRTELTRSKGGLNPIYRKKERVKDEKTGQMVLRDVPGQGPTLYTKLIYSKKNNKFLTHFFNIKDEPLDAMELMGKYCHVNAAIKIESIFIGGTGKISLQVKLYEAVVELSNAGPKKLLSRPPANSKVLMAKNSDQGNGFLDEEDDHISETGSLVDSSEKMEKSRTVEPEPEQEPDTKRKVKTVKVKKPKSDD